MMSGYDVELIKSVVDAVSIPVVALGGAGDIQHFKTTRKLPSFWLSSWEYVCFSRYQQSCAYKHALKEKLLRKYCSKMIFNLNL